MKKVWITLLFVPLLFGCYARSGGIPLFNGYGYNYAPGSVVVQKGDTLYSLSRKYQVRTSLPKGIRCTAFLKNITWISPL